VSEYLKSKIIKMDYNPFKLSGKVVFVSGASSGIGKATAIECSKLGARVLITGRDEKRLNETYNALEGVGHTKFIVDMGDLDKVKDLIGILPVLDGAVHCAGFTKTVPLQFIEEKDFSDIMKVNFFAPTLITQGLIKKGKINKGGSIIFVSSVAGVFCSSVGAGMYSASKGALNGIVKAMALELAVKNIRVNTVCPGMIQTSIYKSGVISEDQLKEDMKKYPLKRYGLPEEVAYAIIYLLSDTTKWVTGSNLLIDGGFTLL
jgi:NAD(P)-dependent dehydrogenase (short-subunit alcohol dehydrogenase family)